MISDKDDAEFEFTESPQGGDDESKENRDQSRGKLSQTAVCSPDISVFVNIPANSCISLVTESNTSSICL